ncbi:hypothetical protein G6F55_004625 [Rhizopus delemar]|uniref:Crossover junction endonuclease MUS81 n=2 Tax=Rhizopus TaxID=4842 RepID=A0A9P7CPN9_9FUNG|nr:hypothetical protein G6F55_004625 [Rhizopus delemar]KAG1544083.1 hypothetical protein G6F51_006284 [Rhizopus arrhizus]KAG1526884.1 hypothetical protein G6F52_002035 [Rhizopus delemar]KAG1555161.1 hypothetical protein G6F49_007400 [Rhizopus delemar]KAG1570044.1 hypothetical protein G6F50_005836 [Rhizopus delemar]
MSQQCGNPLLRDWVKEWMNDAQAMQSKSYYTYKKAYESLCRCPVAFEHPSLVENLEGIGKVMAERLTCKMIKYCQENGMPVPPKINSKRKKKSETDFDDTMDEGNPSLKPKRQKKVYVPAYRSGAYAILLCLLDMKAEGRNSATKEQICTYGQKYCNNSMTLADPGKSYTAFSGIKTLQDKGYVYKNGRPSKYSLTETGVEMAERLRNVGGDGNIIGLSQPLQSDEGSDQTNPAQPSNSSISASEKKQSRRSKHSRAAAYLESMLGPNYELPTRPDMSLYVLNPSEHQSITINGKTMTTNSSTSSKAGSSLMSSSNNDSNNKQKINLRQIERNEAYIDTNDADDILNIDHTTEANILYQRESNLSSRQTTLARNPTILSIDDDSEVKELNLSQATIPDTNSVLEKDYFPLSQTRQSQIAQEKFHFTYLDVSNQHVRHVSSAAIAFDEENACLTYKIRFYSKQKNHPKAKYVVKVEDDKDNPDCCVGYLFETQMETVCTGLPAIPILPLHRQEIDDFWPNNSSNNCSQTSLRSRSELISSQQTYDSQTPSQHVVSSQQRQKEQVLVDVSQLIESEHVEPISPGEYEIMLILDSREIQMKNNRSYIQNRLSSKGINLSTRSLDLGDVIWIARKKGSTRQSDELFLDYVVERKRLDDLVYSIKDGRFTEQKTRLKRAGAKKVIYIVEEYNRGDAANFGLQSIQTAMSSTQIIDGIFLKRTNGIDETIDYLVCLTKLIERIYKETTLYPIPEHIVTSQNYLELRKAYKEKLGESNSVYLISYPVYNQINSKNGSTNLHEIYLRMLMCIKGVNAEKALALMRIYPTPHSLLSAFRNKPKSVAINLAKDATQTQISRRRWGTHISEKLYQIWGSLEYPNAETYSS